jgi:hypothetical protein
MTLPEATTKSHIALRRCKIHAATAVLCLLSIGLAQASESLKHSTHTSKSKSARPAIASISLKDRLVWLRDFTARNFLPAHNSLGDSQIDRADDTYLQFDGERQLFKPVSRDAYSDSLKKIVQQQLGLQIGPNTQFQCDFQRFWTVDDRQEVAVKLGLHFGFR